MNKLIFNNVVTMSSKEIAELTGKNHGDVLRDVRNMLGELNLGESTFACTYLDSQNKERPLYNLPKREVLILVSGYNVVLRSKIVDKIDELELYSLAPQVPQTYATALLEAGRLALELEKAETQLTEQAPKVEFYEVVISTDQLIDMAQASKVLNLGYGRNKLFTILRDLKVLDSQNIPFQKYIDRKWFKVKETVFKSQNKEHLHLKPLVTQKGLKALLKLLTKKGM
jgi:Rha family phage regulatory protein